MEKCKITLVLDVDLVRRAKKLARIRRVSLTHLFREFLLGLPRHGKG